MNMIRKILILMLCLGIGSEVVHSTGGTRSRSGSEGDIGSRSKIRGALLDAGVTGNASEKVEGVRREEKKGKKKKEKQQNNSNVVHEHLGGRLGPTTVEAAINQALMEHILDSEGDVKLLEKLQEDFWGQGLPEATKWCAISGLMGGLTGSISEEMKKRGGAVLGSTFDTVKEWWFKLVRFIFHRGSMPVTISDTGRWRNTIRNMFEELFKIAEQAKISGGIKDGAQRLFAGELNAELEPGKEQEKQEVQIDQNWEENKQLFLARIEQLVMQLEYRKKYYAQDDEIVNCLDRLIDALGIRHIETNDGEKQEVISGIYKRLKEAASLTEVVSPQTKIALQLFKVHLDGLMTELQDWVHIKEGKDVNSSTGRYGSSYSSGYSGYSGSGSNYYN